jgi:hypothetical protein
MPDLGAASFHHQFLETRKITLKAAASTQPVCRAS